MTDSQKNSEWQGIYTDNENMPWKWTCLGSRPKPDEDPEIEYIEVIREKMIVP